MNSTSCTSRSGLLIVAGYIGIALAVFQGVISCSPSWSLYWGAPPDLVAHPVTLLVEGEIAAVIFAIFGLYAFSGAGRMRRLPFLRTALIVVSTLFIMRGLLLVAQIYAVSGGYESTVEIPLRAMLSSAASLVIGLIYLAGIVSSWRLLKHADMRCPQ